MGTFEKLAFFGLLNLVIFVAMVVVVGAVYLGEEIGALCCTKLEI